MGHIFPKVERYLRAPVLFIFLYAFAAAGGATPLAAYILQAEDEVSPEATPQLKSIKPAEGAPGDEVTVLIGGGNFSKAVYVSFSNPAVHTVSLRRVSATELEVRVQIGKKAAPGPMTLYVSNTASGAVEGTFTIKGDVAPPPGPLEPKPTETDAPLVTAVDPPRAARGSEASLKVSGKNFVTGTKISFSNPGIRIIETTSAKPTELVARIRIAADAAAGSTSLFVVNPDDREAEATFEVTGASPAAPGAEKPASTGGLGDSAALRFEVLNLGEARSILQNPGKARGTLSFAGGKLRYEESGGEVISAAAANIKEIDANVILGVNTGTFHITLGSGTTYNFIAASLKPADSQSIVEALQRALR